MNISLRAIEQLTDIITGNSKVSPYRTEAKLIEFFRHYGDIGDDEPEYWNRAQYAQQKLTKYNGTAILRKIITDAFGFFDDDDYDPREPAESFNRILARDGYQLELKHPSRFTKSGQFWQGSPYYEIESIASSVINPESLIALNHARLTEHIQKADAKIESGDYAGAITSCYTLTEQLLKIILREADVDPKEAEGDIRKLYTAARNSLNLNPADDGIDRPLKPILEGLQKLVSGLYEISNKAGDRHARRYDPAAHHAKLVVNAAFAFCEFLMESREYQRAKD